MNTYARKKGINRAIAVTVVSLGSLSGTRSDAEKLQGLSEYPETVHHMAFASRYKRLPLLAGA